MVTGTWGVSHTGSSIRPSTYRTVIAARLIPASHIVHNHQSIFSGPDKSAETHDPPVKNISSFFTLRQHWLNLLASAQSKATTHESMYTTYSNGEYKVTPGDDKQVKYSNPHKCTVISLPEEIVPFRKPNTKGNSHVPRRKLATLRKKEHSNTRRGKKENRNTFILQCIT